MENEGALGLQGQKQKKKKKSAIDDFNSTKKLYKDLKNVSRFIRIAFNPAIAWAIGGAVFAIILYMMFFQGDSATTGSGGGGGGGNTQISPAAGIGSPGTSGLPPIPGLTLTLEGPIPDRVDNGQDLKYQITIKYDSSTAKVPLDSISIYDDLPPNVSFLTTDGASTQTGNTIAWSLANPTNKSPIVFYLHPQKEDMLIANKVYAKTTGASSGTGAGGTSPQAFRSLIAGQGRNVAVLGDKSQFISTVLANAGSLTIAGQTNELAKIYDAAVHYNVNPLILTTIYGVESSFGAAQIPYPFGCFETATGFDENVTCAGGSLNMHMNTFETTNANGSLEIPSKIGNTCIYTDPFDYAYEEYTPVCAADDGNDPSRATFMSIYTQLKGT